MDCDVEIIGGDDAEYENEFIANRANEKIFNVKQIKSCDIK